MEFGSKNKIDPSFSMSSMTDIVFLLLIFFMLTSNFATPSGLPISMPRSVSSKKVIPKVNVTITKDRRYLLNQVEISLDLLEDELRYSLEDSGMGVVVLRIDKDVPVQYLVNVAGIANKLNARVSIATMPEK